MEEFKKSVNKEIATLEEVKIWDVMVRKHIPEKQNLNLNMGLQY